MKHWKRKTAAMGMAAMMMIPGTAYGHSPDLTNIDLCTYREQLIQLLEDYFQPGLELPDLEVQPEGNQPGHDQAGTIAAEMLAQVNAQRRSAGLAELSLSQELTKVAQVKAEDMRDNGYFSHTSPTYGSPFDMMREFGIRYRIAGENIAKGQRSVDQVMQGWMNSDGHRANILNAEYTHLGVGYCTDKSGNGYWVQMFIEE